MIADFKAEFPPATRVLPTLLATRAAQYGDAPLFACGATRLLSPVMCRQIPTPSMPVHSVPTSVAVRDVESMPLLVR